MPYCTLFVYTKISTVLQKRYGKVLSKAHIECFTNSKSFVLIWGMKLRFHLFCFCWNSWSFFYCLLIEVSWGYVFMFVYCKQLGLTQCWLLSIPKISENNKKFGSTINKIDWNNLRWKINVWNMIIHSINIIQFVSFSHRDTK